MAYVPESKSVKLEGFAEFEQQLKEMAEGFRGDLVARNTLVPAAKVAMESVLQTAKTRAPVGDKARDSKNPIHMRDTIRLDARIPSEKDKRSDYVNETDGEIGRASCREECDELCRSRWSPYH
jgi:hypothetical protein